MAVLRRRLTGKTLITIITAVVLLAVAVPAVSAFEAHTINVRCYVEQPFNLFKTAELATATDWEGLEINWDWENYPPNPWDPLDAPPWNEVPMDKCVVWVVTINVCNPYDYIMYNVVVTDNFSAELNGVEMADCPYDVVVPHIAKGRWKKTQEPNQIRIDWDDFNLDPTECVTLELLVWLRKNPAGHQEYTSEGCYTLNSGPTAKWLDAPDGHQFSFDAEPLYVKTTGWGACPTQ